MKTFHVLAKPVHSKKYIPWLNNSISKLSFLSQCAKSPLIFRQGTISTIYWCQKITMVLLVMAFSISGKVMPIPSLAATNARGYPVALDARADDRLRRAFTCDSCKKSTPELLHSDSLLFPSKGYVSARHLFDVTTWKTDVQFAVLGGYSSTEAASFAEKSSRTTKDMLYHWG